MITRSASTVATPLATATVRPASASCQCSRSRLCRVGAPTPEAARRLARPGRPTASCSQPRSTNALRGVGPWGTSAKRPAASSSRTEATSRRSAVSALPSSDIGASPGIASGGASRRMTSSPAATPRRAASGAPRWAPGALDSGGAGVPHCSKRAGSAPMRVTPAAIARPSGRAATASSCSAAAAPMSRASAERSVRPRGTIALVRAPRRWRLRSASAWRTPSPTTRAATSTAVATATPTPTATQARR